MMTSTSWQQGESGNPNGRPPKGESITELIREHLSHKMPGFEITYKKAFVERLLNMAIKGNIQAMKLVLEYADYAAIKHDSYHVCSVGKPILGGISSLNTSDSVNT